MSSLSRNQSTPIEYGFCSMTRGRMRRRVGGALCLLLGLTVATATPPPVSALQQLPSSAAQQENRSFYVCRPVRFPTPGCDPAEQWVLVGRFDRIRVNGLEGRDGTRVSIYRRSGQHRRFELWKRPTVRNGSAVVSWAPGRQDWFQFKAQISQGGQTVETNYLRINAELDFL